MTITTKSTKAELLQYIQELEVSEQAATLALAQAQPT